VQLCDTLAQWGEVTGDSGSLHLHTTSHAHPRRSTNQQMTYITMCYKLVNDKYPPIIAERLSIWSQIMEAYGKQF
jgi:hypothetical protein